MSDTEKICGIVKIPHTEGLSQSFAIYCANMFKLFKPIQGIKLEGHAILDNAESVVVNYLETEQKPENLSRELALSNGQVKGVYFISSRAVG